MISQEFTLNDRGSCVLTSSIWTTIAINYLDYGLGVRRGSLIGAWFVKSALITSRVVMGLLSNDGSVCVIWITHAVIKRGRIVLTSESM